MIVQVSTNQSGGAGIAARRLHEGLIKYGVDSRLLSALGTPSSVRGMDVLPKAYPRAWKRALRKIGFGLSVQERWNRKCQEIRCADIFVSGLQSDLGLLEHESFRSADLINLHWVAGVLPWVDFFKANSKPVVWTLHDMNPFMGIFHYETDRCRGNPNSQQLDECIRKQKSVLLESTHPPVIVSPSNWLLKQSLSSPLFARFRHEQIPNGLNTCIFKPFPRSFARSVLSLPDDRKLMLVVAERLDDHRKGFDLLQGALRATELFEGWEVVAVGLGNLPIDGLAYHQIDTISDERLLALVYAACDMTIITSREDNFPNVVLESICCGTPVVGTPVGGIPEMIENGFNGILAQHLNAESIAMAISEATRTNFDRNAIAQSAAIKYDQSVQAKRYADLYSELLNNEQTN